MTSARDSIPVQLAFVIGVLALIVCQCGYAASKPKMLTSVSIEKIKSLVPLRDTIAKIAKGNGFTNERNAVYPEYRKSFEESKRFVVEFRAKDDSFILIENTDDAECIVIKLYSDNADALSANKLKDKINAAIQQRFPRGVKVYPDSVCGAAGEVED